MNNFDEWSQIISKFLKAEADLLTSVAKHEIESDSPRSAFIRGVLDLFLPSNLAIGSGRIIDASGNRSDPIDIVIYRRDFPRLNLPGSSDVFLYESVLATVEVRTKLIRKTLFDALDICASIAELNPDLNPKQLETIARQNRLKLNSKNEFVHEHPLLTDRFNLIGRPPSFVYGFNGFQTSPKQLNDNFEIWLEQRKEMDLAVNLKSLPAVVATQGCIGWRNAAPLSANSNHLFGIGADSAPIRLIVQQLLYHINRRLKATRDSYGLKPGVDSYLDKMAAPEMLHILGKARHAVQKTGDKTEIASKKHEPATATKAVEKPQVTAKTRPAAKPESTPRPKAAADPKPTSAKPAQKTESRPTTKPVVEPRPVSAAKPAPATSPSPQAKPVAEPSPVQQSTPDAESRPVTQPTPAVESKPAPQAKPTVESKPVPQAKPVTPSRPIPQTEPAPGPEAQAWQTAEKPPVAKSSPAPEAKPAPQPKPASESRPEAAPVSEKTPFPKPPIDIPLELEIKTRGDSKDMFNKDATLTGMPVPDASLIPEFEPDPVEAEPDPTDIKSDAFIETMPLGQPAPKAATEAKPPVAENKTAEEKPQAQDKASAEADDPFLKTVRIPSPEPEHDIDMEPFSKTIPGLQNPSKSVH